MNFSSIDEIYAANDKMRMRLFEVVDRIDPLHLERKDNGEKWTVSDLVEHIAIVDGGALRICLKLLSKAKDDGVRSGDVPAISDEFEKYAENIDTVKLEAPERVRPTGEKSTYESLDIITNNKKAFEDARQSFVDFNASEVTFPHPFFGPLSACEWLILAGEHMRRHTKQIVDQSAKYTQ